MKDSIKFTGTLEVTHTLENGSVTQYSLKNLVVDSGLRYIASRMKDATATAMTHMAIGSGSTTPVGANTTLGTELGRVALTSTLVSTNTVVYNATFPAGTGTGTVTEAGLFNNPTTGMGTMLSRSLFALAIPKGGGDSLTVAWTITISA